MRKQRLEATLQVSQALQDAELALDAAIAAAARLAAAMPSARVEAHLAPQFGQAALSSVLSSLGRLGEARGDMIAAHDSLAEVRDQIGMRGATMTTGYDKPEVRQLEVVSAA
jgi:hypothetical protein